MVNSPEKEKIIPGMRLEIEVLCLNTIIHSGNIVEIGTSISVADGDIVTRRVVFFVNRDDFRRRKTVNRCDHGSGNQ